MSSNFWDDSKGRVIVFLISGYQLPPPPPPPPLPLGAENMAVPRSDVTNRAIVQLTNATFFDKEVIDSGSPDKAKPFMTNG